MKRSLISKHERKVNWAITTFKTHLISASVEDKGTLRFSRVVFLLFDALSLAVDFVTVVDSVEMGASFFLKYRVECEREDFQVYSSI